MNEYYYTGIGLIAVLAAAFVIYRLLKVWTVTFHKNGIYKSGPYPRRTYKFHNGLECYQESMEAWQLELFTALLAELEIDENTTLSLDSLNSKLFGKKGLIKLAQIVLVGKRQAPKESLTSQPPTNIDMPQVTIPEAEIARLKGDELEEVMSDFFTLNPKMKQLFGILKNALVSQMRTAQKTMDGGLMTDSHLQNSMMPSADA